VTYRISGIRTYVSCCFGHRRDADAYPGFPAHLSSILALQNALPWSRHLA